MQYFPQLLTGASSQYPILKRTVTRTIRNVCFDGTEVKLADPSGSRLEWQLTYSELVDAEMTSLLDFFNGMEGSLGTFTFLDPADNLLSSSETFDEAVWQKDALLQVSGGVADPMGSSSAYHVANSAGAPLKLRQVLTVPSCYYYSFSIWARSDRPTDISLLRGTESVRRVAVAGWNRLVFSANSESSDTAVVFGIEFAPEASIDLYGAQVEAQIGASPYKKTTSAGGIYPSTRFRDNTLAVSMLGPGRHSCRLWLRTN